MTSLTTGRSVLCLLLLLPAGCADVPGLLSLRAALNQEYPNTPIGVRLTDESILTITFADSPLRGASCESRVAQALQVSTFVRDHYKGFTALRVINIEYASRDASDSVAPRVPNYPIRFDPTAIAAGLTSLDSTRVVGNCKTLDELQ